MLKLRQQQYQEIELHGIASYPHEGCGLLLGLVEDGHNVVYAVRPLPNVWPDESEKPVRFLIAPTAWQQAEIEAAANGLDVIGIFHSHPDDLPIASARDLEWASWPGYSYLITQISGGTPTYSCSWQLKPDRSGFDEECILLSDDIHN